MLTFSDHRHEGRDVTRRMGRPKFRPPIRPLTIQLDRRLFEAMDAIKGEKSYREVIETALWAWIERQTPPGDPSLQ